MPEAWLRGPVQGVPMALMPAAHALVDAAEDMRRAAAELTPEQLWVRPGGAASVGFHLRHVAGSTERLLTYARGESLSREQLATIPLEPEPGDRPPTARELLDALDQAMAEALDAFRATAPDTLFDDRGVGRANLPSTVQGLLFHAAEHARRHAGQVVATAKILRGVDDGSETPSAPPGPEEVRSALIVEAIRAYDDAGIRGLCAEGRWDVALDAMRSMELGEGLGTEG